MSLGGLNAYNPYSHSLSRMPEGEMFPQNSTLVLITPERPLIVRERNGSINFVDSEGNVMVRLNTRGDRTFYVGGRKSHIKNKDGNLEKTWVREPGSNVIEVRNEFGELIGMEEYRGMGLIAEYDEAGNRTRTYQYDDYGKSVKWIVDELTMGKTINDHTGNPIREVNFEGYTMAWYRYDENNNLEYKQDVYGNITYYDRRGNMIKTEDRHGNVITTYSYKRTEDGYTVLSSARDETTGNITVFEGGRPQHVKNRTGAVVEEYEWLGTNLIYTHNKKTNEITWYDNSKPILKTYKGFLVEELIYHEGKLAAIWSYENYSLRLFKNGRNLGAEMGEFFGSKPAIDEILMFREAAYPFLFNH